MLGNRNEKIWLDLSENSNQHVRLDATREKVHQGLWWGFGMNSNKRKRHEGRVLQVAIKLHNRGRVDRWSVKTSILVKIINGNADTVPLFDVIGLPTATLWYPQSMRFVGDYSESIRIEGYCAYLELYGRCSMPRIDYSQTGADL
jgi:hypothetical protein